MGHFERLQRREALERLPYAEPRNQRQRQQQNDSSRHGVLCAASPQEEQHRQQCKFPEKTDNPAARSGEKQCADRYQREETSNGPPLAAHPPQRQRNQPRRNHELHQTGKVIAVHIGPEGNSAVAHFAEPVQLPIESQMLQDPENRHGESERHDKPNEPFPILRGLESLRRQKDNDEVGQEKLKVHACGVAIDGEMELPLREDQDGKQNEGRKSHRELESRPSKQ